MTCVLDRCPPWLVRVIWKGLAEWTGRVINSSLGEGMAPSFLKTMVVRSLLKKLSLDPTSLDNYQPVSSLPFLSTTPACGGK